MRFLWSYLFFVCGLLFSTSSLTAAGLDLNKRPSITLEPAFIQTINNMLAREVGKSVEIGTPKEKIDTFKKSVDLKPLFLLHADFGDLISGDIFGFVTSLFECNNYIYRNKVDKTRIGFDLAKLELKFLDDTHGEQAGYALVVRLENVFVKGLFENHTEWYEFNCSDTKLPWRLEKSFIEFEVPLVYEEGAGFVVGAIKHSFPSEWVGSVEFGTVEMNDLVIDYLMVEYLDELIANELGDTPSTGLNGDIQASFRELAIDIESLATNLPNPVQSGLNELLAEVNAAPLSDFYLETLDDQASFSSGRATVSAQLAGNYINPPLPTCLDAFAPTAGQLDPQTPPPTTNAALTSRFSLRIMEWFVDQSFNSGRGCFSIVGMDLSPFINSNLFNLIGEDDLLVSAIGDIEVAVRDARFEYDYQSGGNAWQDLQGLRLAIDLRSTVAIDATIYDNSTHLSIDHDFPPYTIESTLTFPVAINLNNATRTFEVQIDLDNFADANELVAAQGLELLDEQGATDYQMEVIRTFIIEDLGRLFSNLSFSTFRNFHANGGIFFCKALDQSTEDVDDMAWFISCPDANASPQLDFNFGTFFADLSELKVNAAGELLASFDILPAYKPDPPKSYLTAQPLNESWNDLLEMGGMRIEQKPNESDASLARLRRASATVEYAYLPKSTYYTYFVHNARDAIKLRGLVENSSEPGAVRIISGLPSNDSYQLYTRSLQVSEFAGEEKNCIDSIRLQPWKGNLNLPIIGGFMVDEFLIKPKRRSRFAGSDLLPTVNCHQSVASYD